MTEIVSGFGVNMARFYPNITKRIVAYLDRVDEASTPQIYDHLKDTTKQAPTTNQLANMLAKNKVFVKVGMTSTRALTNGRYEVTVWALANRYSDGT